MATKKVVSQGVFDPRNYKNTDPNWARRRKSDWLACTGKIKYTREMTVPDEVWWDKKEEDEEDEKEKTDFRDVPIQINQEKAAQPTNTRNTSLKTIPNTGTWPRRRRTDITALIN